jgi:hypothetical protein
MFSLARRYVKTSLFFFLVGLAIGMWILVEQFIWSRIRAVGSQMREVKGEKF